MVEIEKDFLKVRDWGGRVVLQTEHNRRDKAVVNLATSYRGYV